VGYDEPRVFTEAQIRFLKTLAGEAALGASNASLYAAAEVGRQRLEAVLSSTPEPVLVFDKNMRLLLLNPASIQVDGLLRSSKPGEDLKTVVAHEGLRELLSAPVLDKTQSREFAMPNGRVYAAAVSPVMAQGSFFGSICILRDITHYKELDSMKSEFVQTVSHDLRSPLTLMRGYATMLQMVGKLNEQQHGYADKIVAGVDNMSRLVNNLLDLGRVEAGIGLKIEEVSAREVVERVLKALKPHADQNKLKIGVDGFSSDTPLMLEADPALLEQAIYNLVENAIKYTSTGGKIIVRLKIKPTSFIFEVQDTGIGISPIDLPHMFEKFYRSGRKEAYTQRGAGLGLAIVKSIVERHNGRAFVESQLGKGSKFSIEMPFKQPEIARE
jgi:two-component system NtrC family sensor kinase